MQKIPAFHERRTPRIHRRGRPAAQQPRVEIVRHRCGHVTPEYTETYTEGGMKRFREKFAQRNCGMCEPGERRP